MGKKSISTGMRISSCLISIIGEEESINYGKQMLSIILLRIHTVMANLKYLDLQILCIWGKFKSAWMNLSKWDKATSSSSNRSPITK